MLDKSILLEQNCIREVSESMKEYFEVPYCSLVTSGTVAIEVALKGLELQRGSKVLIPDISFIATASAVVNVGLIPIYGDCSPKTWGLSYEEVKETYKETSDLKVVIVVHFAGIVNRHIMEISDFCKQHNIWLIEDCAQVFGGGYQGKKCGTIGDIGVFSFQTSKIITCGEGGMILTSNRQIANNVAMLIDWGLNLESDRKLHLPCSNFRINQFAATFLKKQIAEVDSIINERIEIYEEITQKVLSAGMKIQFKDENSSFKDIPFFILVESSKPNHVLHPIGEYPMHLSVLVRSIIQTLYPDLLNEYEKVNKGRSFENSVNLVNSTNFLPLFKVKKEHINNLIHNLQ